MSGRFFNNYITFLQKCKTRSSCLCGFKSSLSCKLLVVLIILSSCDWIKDSSNVHDLPDAPEKIIPLKIGDKIPDIKLTNSFGGSIELTALLKIKPTILIYDRGSWCMYCNQQFRRLQELERDIIDLDYQIITVSPDIPSKLLHTIKDHSITYLMLSDSAMIGAKKLGIAYKAHNLYRDALDVLKEYSNQDHYLLPVPSVFIVDMDALIQFTYINPDFRKKITPELLLAAAKSAIDE